MKNAVIALSAALAFAGCRVADVDTSLDNQYSSTIKEAREEYSLGEKAKVFWTDFLLDVTDMISLGVSAGNGIHANAHVTKLWEAGVGYFGGYEAGILPRAIGAWQKKNVEGGLFFAPGPIWYWRDGERGNMKGTSTLEKYHQQSWQGFTYEQRGEKSRQWLDVGASAHLIVLGAFADIHVWEVVDTGVKILAVPVWVADMLRVPGAEQLWKWMDIVGDDTPNEDM